MHFPTPRCWKDWSRMDSNIASSTLEAESYETGKDSGSERNRGTRSWDRDASCYCHKLAKQNVHVQLDRNISNKKMSFSKFSRKLFKLLIKVVVALPLSDIHSTKVTAIQPWHLHQPFFHCTVGSHWIHIVCHGDQLLKSSETDVWLMFFEGDHWVW